MHWSCDGFHGLIPDDYHGPPAVECTHRVTTPSGVQASGGLSRKPLKAEIDAYPTLKILFQNVQGLEGLGQELKISNFGKVLQRALQSRTKDPPVYRGNSTIMKTFGACEIIGMSARSSLTLERVLPSCSPVCTLKNRKYPKSEDYQDLSDSIWEGIYIFRFVFGVLSINEVSIHNASSRCEVAVGKRAPKYCWRIGANCFNFSSDIYHLCDNWDIATDYTFHDSNTLDNSDLTVINALNDSEMQVLHRFISCRSKTPPPSSCGCLPCGGPKSSSTNNVASSAHCAEQQSSSTIQEDLYIATVKKVFIILSPSRLL